MGAKILILGDKSKQKHEKSLIIIKDVRKKPDIWDFFAIFARPIKDSLYTETDRLQITISKKRK